MKKSLSHTRVWSWCPISFFLATDFSFILLATEKISKATSVSDDNRLSKGDNLKLFLKIPKEKKIDREIGIILLYLLH